MDEQEWLIDYSTAAKSLSGSFLWAGLVSQEHRLCVRPQQQDHYHFISRGTFFMQLKCTFWCFRWEVTGMFALLTQLEGLFVNKNYHLFFPHSPPNLLFFALLPFHPPLPLSLLFPCFWPSITSLLHPSHLQPRGVMKLRWPLQGEYDKLWNHECANNRKPKYGGGGGLPGDGPA